LELRLFERFLRSFLRLGKEHDAKQRALSRVHGGFFQLDAIISPSPLKRPPSDVQRYAGPAVLGCERSHFRYSTTDR
jgi:hypothetical protein